MSSPDVVSLAAYLDLVAAKTPAPGGGAVASAAGAFAAAIAQMVVAYSVGKKSLAEHEDALRSALSRLDRARALLLALAEEDALAYRLVSDLMRLEPDDPERADRWNAAVAAAIRVPQSVLATAGDLLRLFESLTEITNPRLASDLGVAAVMGEATARAAAWNVGVNLSLLDDAEERERLESETRVAVEGVRIRAASVEEACRRLAGATA